MAKVASQQHGNISHKQLTAAGLGRNSIGNWVSRGRLFRRHRGVYALGHVALPPFSAEMAAVLACQPRALLSHHSAAYLWGLGKQAYPVNVTVVGRNIRQREGIAIHRIKTLAKSDALTRHGIPVTSPARTIIDLAQVLNERKLELTLHEAIALRLLTTNALKTALDRYPHGRGTASLRTMIDRPQDALTRSPAEEDLLKLIRRAGLPAPRVNARIGPWSPDFYWPRHKLAVEVDGVDFHSSRVRIERDHRKDIDLRTRGIDVMRFVPRQVKREPELVLVTIARELARREP